MNFSEFLITNLNTEQRNAVEQQTGSLLVIAGAGSGKTRVITARITNLIINHHVQPQAIIGLTFTHKASQEMQQRIKKFLPTPQDLPFVGTFHGFCLRLLKQHRTKLHLEQFSILDEDDQLKMIGLIMERLSITNKRITAKNLVYQISSLKNSTILHDSFYEMLAQDRLLQEVFLGYEAEKKASKCFDFDDLLIEVVKLFRHDHSFKQWFQETVQHVLIDEYQDTSLVQHELLKEMTLANGTLQAQSVCVVGDEDQSIYSWRGATVDNILHFKKDFPGTKMIKIEQNYRSVQQILDVANSIIHHNVHRNPKQLWSTKKEIHRVLTLRTLSGSKEGNVIAQYVQQAHEQKPNDSIAVLYRTHFQSRIIEEALIKHSIPYKIIGGIQFYERKEIKDIFAYLRLITNPFDKISFLRIINCPPRGLGAKFEEQWFDYWMQQPLMNTQQLGSYFIEQHEITGKKKEALEQFLALLHNRSAQDNALETVNTLLDAVDYIDYLKTAFDQEESQQKIENVRELLRALHHFAENGIVTIEQFLYEVALMQERLTAQEKEQHHVQLMTLHAAKGLEFDHILLAGLEEGLLPSSRSLVDDVAIEEERRLCYVGITRAREYLVLLHTQYRTSYGQTETPRPSRFLEEIAPHLLQEHHCMYWNEQEYKELFNEFFGHKKTVTKIQTFGASTKTTMQATSKSASVKPWQKNHFAEHKIFGIGLIKEVEQKDNGTTVLTIQFKNGGTKKIDASFVKSV